MTEPIARLDHRWEQIAPNTWNGAHAVITGDEVNGYHVNLAAGCDRWHFVTHLFPSLRSAKGFVEKYFS